MWVIVTLFDGGVGTFRTVVTIQLVGGVAAQFAFGHNSTIKNELTSALQFYFCLGIPKDIVNCCVFT